MAKRFFDIVVAVFALLVTAPLWLAVPVGVAISSPGPIFYYARRVGRDGMPFNMVKFRTMTAGSGGQSEITAPGDNRVYPFGHLLRLLKIDEIPQFLNVLRGEMSIVGPRPESDVLVARNYTAWMRETLAVRPGLSSVGALFGYNYDDELIDPDCPEESYVQTMLPAKLALERAYLDRASFFGDIAVIFRTAAAILGVPLGMRFPPSEADLRAAGKWAAPPVFPAALRPYVGSGQAND